MRSITFLSVNYMITYARLSCVLLLTMEGDAILKLFYMVIPHWISIGTSVYSKQCTLISNRVIDFDTAAQNWNWMFTNMTPPLTMHLLLPPLWNAFAVLLCGKCIIWGGGFNISCGKINILCGYINMWYGYFNIWCSSVNIRCDDVNI